AAPLSLRGLRALLGREAPQDVAAAVAVAAVDLSQYDALLTAAAAAAGGADPAGGAGPGRGGGGGARAGGAGPRRRGGPRPRRGGRRRRRPGATRTTCWSWRGGSASSGGRTA